MIRSAKPMIDLLMLLLLLFGGQQVATTVQSQNVSVSEVEHISSESGHDDLVADGLRRISFDLLSDGKLLLYGEETSMPDLIAEARARRVVKVYMRIEGDVSYARIRTILHELNDNGLSIELG